MAGRKVKDYDAFPTKQLLVLAVCRFAEPIAFNSIMAYSFAMVRDLNHSEKDASFYSGLLVSAYAVAETVTAMGWGMLSDRYGRKPIVLSGLGGVAISCLILGFAQNYWVALFARFLGGALNGNVSVMQTMVAEIVVNPAHEPLAYASQPFVWTLGGLLGSALGGFLAKPADFYPGVFDKNGFWGKYEYLLPNLASFVIISISIIQGIIFLEETNPRCIKEEDSDDEDETTPLNPEGNANPADRASIDENSPLIAEDGAFGTMGNADVASSASSQTIAAESGPYEGPVYNKTVIMCALALGIFSYHQMAFVTLVPIHLIDEPHAPKGHLDLTGGFGMTLHDVSTFLAAEGVSSLLIQAFIFPIFLRKLGVWRSFVFTTCIYPICYLLMPFLWAIPSVLKPGIYISLVLQVFFGITMNPSLLILLKNAAPDKRALGRIMGLGMSACCFARTIAPPLAGVVYDAGGSGAAWFSSAAIAVVGIVQMLFVPRGEIKKASVDDEVIVGGH